MSHNAYKFLAAGFLSVVGLATSAQATFFSAASDVNDQSPTFLGTAASGGSFTMTDSGPSNRFNLLVDDNNGPLPSLTFSTNFVANLSATFLAPTPINGSTMLYTYAVTGSFSFVDPGTGHALLTCTIGSANPALLSVQGSDTTWFTTGAVLGADSYADVTYTVSQDLVNAIINAGHTAAEYGLTTGNSSGPDDFAFDLSKLNIGDGTTPVSLDGMMPTTAWQSEGSYSGSAFYNNIPAPGTLAIAGFGGLALTRRRRQR